MFSRLLDQSIQHESLSDAELRNSMIQAGMSEDYAGYIGPSSSTEALPSNTNRLTPPITLP
ncbi:hypothetical protein MKY42_14050 [Paenibacillus sp. FSL W7-1088]|uniref:hypothetical protein n=1 Tax=Paenibacillus sp. FSL W7-1088 TaxID=2921695 RepID=UPI0030EE6CD3